MKILVFATDILPIKGIPTSGTALRTHGLIQGLKAHGHDVVSSVPENAISGFKRSDKFLELDTAAKAALSELEELSFNSFNQADVLARVKPDVILCGHWPAMTLRVKPKQPIVIDLAGPHLLERHYQGSENPKGAALAKLAVLATSDYFIVSGQKQKLYFLSFLLRAGIKNPEKKIITLPMPLDPQTPEHKLSDETSFPKFIFGGVFLPWQDPTMGLETLAAEIKERDKGSLTMIGGKHPNYDIQEGKYGKLFSELPKQERVEVKPMMPLESFLDELKDADVALDLMSWNLERELAMTIRSTTYLWSGLPVIYNNFADLGEIISRYDAGWTVDPSKPEELRKVIAEIYRSPEIVKQKSLNATRLAEDLFSWDKAVEPLLNLLNSPEVTDSHQTDIIVDCPESADYPVLRQQDLRQFFVCRVPGLSKVECKIATHDRKGLKPITLKLFELSRKTVSRRLNHQVESKQLLAEREIPAEQLHNNEWLSIETTPIPNSDGRTFAIELSSNATSEAESISPWALKSNPFPLVGMEYKNRSVDHAGICLRTTCKNSKQEQQA